MKFSLTVKKNADNESQQAKQIIELIVFCFRIISLFTNENHLKIVEQLYLTKNNILSMGIRHFSNKLFLDEKTLYAYRKKYGMVILFVIGNLINIKNLNS